MRIVDKETVFLFQEKLKESKINFMGSTKRKYAFLREKIVGAGKPKGFTMAELIVVTCILALGITVFFRFFASRNKSESSLTNRLVLQIQARQAADNIVSRFRKASEIVKPTLGETNPSVVFLDSINRVCFIYPTKDVENSSKFKKDLFELLFYQHAYPGSPDTSMCKTLAKSLKRVAFTLLSPNSIQIDVTVADEKGEYEFLTTAGLMNFGAEDK